MSLIEALLLAVVEGLTEYLPISSTGHLVLTSALFGIHEVGVVKHYMIIVQFGAILAVVFEYFRWIKSHTSFFPTLMVGFIPAAVVGLAVKSYIDALLSHVLVVAIALILGGIVLLFTDRFFERQKDKSESHLGHVTMKQSFLVGVFQCLAFVPGVSRAGASIWGGAFAGMNKKVATEFSFLLAVPTLTAASGYKLMKAWPELSMDDLNLFLIGNVVSFIVGWITIRFFIQMVVKHGFKFFGYYRIVLGSIVVAVWAMGMISA